MSSCKKIFWKTYFCYIKRKIFLLLTMDEAGACKLNMMRAVTCMGYPLEEPYRRPSSTCSLKSISWSCVKMSGANGNCARINKCSVGAVYKL